MLEFHTLVTILCHGGNPTCLTCHLWEGYPYILREVREDHLMEVLPLGDLMVLKDLETFLLMVLMVRVVLGGLVGFLLMALEGLVALHLVVPEALLVCLLVALVGLVVCLLLVLVVLVVLGDLVAFLLMALEGLVALHLVVPVALKVSHLPEVPEGLLSLHLVVPVALEVYHLLEALEGSGGPPPGGPGGPGGSGSPPLRGPGGPSSPNSRNQPPMGICPSSSPSQQPVFQSTYGPTGNFMPYQYYQYVQPNRQLPFLVSCPDFDPVTLDVYDVYIVNDHGVELKAKAPPLIGYAMFWI